MFVCLAMNLLIVSAVALSVAKESIGVILVMAEPKNTHGCSTSTPQPSTGQRRWSALEYKPLLLH